MNLVFFVVQVLVCSYILSKFFRFLCVINFSFCAFGSFFFFWFFFIQCSGFFVSIVISGLRAIQYFDIFA